MSRVNLGRVTMMPKGVWNNSSTYKRLDIVTNNGASYIALQDVPANTVVTNTTYWMAVTPNFSIGEVSTLNPSENASASITSTSTGELNLNLGIPRGISGNETIDDSAGLGDIDVVWSANKTKTEVNSKQSAVTKSVSGSIVSFDDGVEAPAAHVVANIEPVQDLHGYDHPWPAGGGKNLINPDTLINGYYGESGTFISSTSFKTTPLIPVSPNTTYSASFFDKNKTRIGALAFTFWDANETFISQASVAASVTTTAETAFVRIRNLQAQTTYIENDNFLFYAEQGSSSNIFTPHSNICPISGWTDVNVTRAGKNIYPVKIGADKWRNFQGGTYTNNNGELVVSMSSTLYSGVYSHTLSSQIGELTKMPVLASYSFDVKASEATEIWIGYNNYGHKKFQIGTDYQRLTFTGIQFGTYTSFNIYNGTTSTVTVYLKDFQFELGSTVTAYEPYQGDTYNITFPSEVGTVYGGELDVTSGKLTVDSVKHTVSTNDTAVFGWVGSDSTRIGIRLITSNKKTGASVEGLKCNILNPTISALNQDIYGNCCIYYDGTYINFMARVPSDLEQLSERLNWLVTNNCEFTYHLTTPITYQFTPTEVTTLLGQNNIWAGTGDITIDYQYDINKALGEKADNTKITSNIESASQATRNYEAGSLAIVQNQLLRITQNIATGGAITIGSNAETIDLETLIAEKAEKILVAKLPFLSSASLYNDIADFHNAMPRGKDITAYLTDGSLWNRINGANGYSLFEDLYVGDYLTAGGQQYMIVDFDYYIRCGYGMDITQHHLMMMPLENMNIPEGTMLYGSSDTLILINTANYREYTGDDTVTVSSQENAINKKWNATMEAPNANSTAGGYKYSRMRQVIMRAADTIVINAFGADHAKPINVWYPNPADAAASGLASNAAWFANDDWTAPDRKSICDLPNETQIYGQQVWGRGSVYTNLGYEIGTDKWQFSLFRYNRNRANIRVSWWLRSVYSAGSAASVANGGYAGYSGTSNALGVRPRFLLFG